MKGYATRLLKFAINKSIKKGLYIIELDDMSDNFRKQHNIYVKHGFGYVSDHGPEMIKKLY